MSQSIREITGGQNGTECTTEAEIYRLLSSKRRRILLDVIESRGTPVNLEDLARSVAGREAQPEEAKADHVQEVMIALHHTHLPKMADVGIADYDPDAKQVE